MFSFEELAKEFLKCLAFTVVAGIIICIVVFKFL